MPVQPVQPVTPERPRSRLPRSARRAQLLSAAQQVFVAQGYHAAAMDEIAERAGVSKPVLYQHFPGKLDLYLALVERHAQDLVLRVRGALDSTTENRRRVHATMQAYFDFVAGDGEAFRLIFETDLRNEPAVRDRVERALAECHDAIKATIVADTDVTEAEADLIAVALTGMAEVTARSWLASGGSAGPVSKERAVELLFNLAWRGLRRAPVRGEPAAGGSDPTTGPEWHAEPPGPEWR
jgi:AcrR family transcriptional regulator